MLILVKDGLDHPLFVSAFFTKLLKFFQKFPLRITQKLLFLRLWSFTEF